MLMINSTIFMRSHKVPGTVVLGVQLKLYAIATIPILLLPFPIRPSPSHKINSRHDIL